MARRLRIAAAAAIAVAALIAAPAAASFIVYRCGAAAENLCAINPDGTGQRTLTGDGTADFPYIWPSLTRDGAKLGYVFHSELYVLDLATGAKIGPVTRSATFVAMRPDGGRIGAIDLYPSVTGSGLTPIACSFDAGGGDRDCTISTSTLGWSPDGRLLVDRDSGNANHTYGICAVTARSDGGYDCAPFVAVHPDRNVRDPAVSRDGTVVAATAEEPNSAAGRIVLFDYATGAPLRDLTTGTQDGSPAWSPDGTSLVFERAGSIYVIPTAGGAERLLTAGASPTWGGPADSPGTPSTPGGGTTPAPVLSGVRVASSQRGTKVRVQLTVGRADSTVRVLLRSGGKPVGSVTKRGVAAGTLKLTVKLSASGARKLRKARKLKLTARVTVQAPGAQAAAVTKRLTLKR